MRLANTQHFDRIVEYLRQKSGEDVSLADVMALAEITAESVQTLFDTMDSAIYRELREIAEYIATTRSEISALQAHELTNNRIPAAGQELDAIVKATEAATNSIMECAETLMAADSSDPRAYKALVDEKMLLIFEACSFQDITGQRIAKVVETLQHIETRVSRCATAMHVKDARGFMTEQEKARAERREKLLLHGPSLTGDGVDQAEVDQLIGDAKQGDGDANKGSAQADIDRLFA